MLDTCFHQVFSFFASVFKECVGRASEQLFNGLFGHLRQFLEYVSQLFEDTENLEKCNRSNAQPLFLSFQRQWFSSFVHAFFKTSSKTAMCFQIVDRFLAIWGLHLETFGTTFCGHVLRSQKSRTVFVGLRAWGQAICDPSGRRGELTGHLGDIWEASRRTWGQDASRRNVSEPPCFFSKGPPCPHALHKSWQAIGGCTLHEDCWCPYLAARITSV